MPGTLFVVATPIGNLDDTSPRAQRLLGRVSLVACEDTRRTAQLLERFGATVPTVSCHKFNERERLIELLQRVRSGEDVALVSDGGTPGVSDPGRHLVEAALEAGLPVSPIPGPSAVAALLSVSGLPADRFVFEGFLPARPGERRRRLRALRAETRTLVLFEAPHRLLDTLRDLAAIVGERRIVLGRELTKVHETVLRGSARELAEALAAAPVRGEITLALAGADRGGGAAPDEADAAALRRAWVAALSASGGDRRDALRRAARELGVGRAELWRRLEELGEDTGR
ncbi:MAG TPA: 16S rRNA (cytidine(1402)-2'-O)-methyltransferase [Candidatus Polarisedimenticolaceae bacterium]|nr:16S rRNA (cytidine(1402)-2'-O)-methyltransferase [Candidatus Polarisedimenticolaceae bacterium]